MIFYLVTADGKHTMEQYVSSWGSMPESRIRFLLYEDLPGIKALNSGTYIFSDLERLSPAGLTSACQAWKALSKAGTEVRLFNDPSQVLCRYNLLQKLYGEGNNCFKAIRATESFHSLQYPVFIREENSHTGSLTQLLNSQNELIRALRSLRLKGYSPRELLVVEFCDTSDHAGIFRKYSAFIVGGRILPRHVIFSQYWSVKQPNLTNADLQVEQEAYLTENPHESWLRKTFDLAGIEYGRIDYSLKGSIPQVWEINTNPTVRKLTPRLTSAFESIDAQSAPIPTIPFSIDQTLAGKIAIEKRRQRNTQRLRKMVETLTSSQLIRPIVPIMKSIIRYAS